MQELLVATPDPIEDGLVLIGREAHTRIGPVDLQSRDAAGALVAVEVKRTAEIAAVDQLLRYLDLLSSEAARPVCWIVAAQRVVPQARTYATHHGVSCIEGDLELLCGGREEELRLF